MWSASLPAVCPVSLWANVVPRGATGDRAFKDIIRVKQGF